jgi:hypothetical protein
MGMAVGAWRPVGPRMIERPCCFWGIHAVGFNTVVVLGGIGLGALMGVLVGLFTGLLMPDPEPLTHAALAFLLAEMGLKIGAVLGGLISVALIVGSKCSNCGFCFCIVAFRTPFGVPPIPVPVFMHPCTANCAPPPAGLVPPGCP